MRRSLLALVGVAVASLAWACSDDETPLASPLQNAGAADAASSDAATSDAGREGSTTMFDSGPPAPPPAFKCRDAGATAVDASACSVSFASDVLSALDSCTNCHGGTQSPFIDGANPDVTWRSLTDWESLKVKKPLVNPCSSSTADSYLWQTVDTAAPAKDRGPLMPPGTGLSAAKAAIVKQWIACGAPNN